MVLFYIGLGLIRSLIGKQVFYVGKIQYLGIRERLSNNLPNT